MRKLGLRSKLRGTWPVIAPPISLWRFDEATGDDDLVDAFGSNDLTAAETHTRVAGVVGYGQTIGATGFAVATNDFNFITSPFSLAFWFKRSAGTDTLLVQYDNAGSIAFGVQVGETFIVAVTDVDGAGGSISDSYTTPSDTWTFACMRYDGSLFYLNVNGRDEVSDGAATLSDQTGGTLTIVPTGTVAIDHGGICDYCMTAEEVHDLYVRTRAGASVW